MATVEAEKELQSFLAVLQKKTRGVAIFGESEKRGFYWVKSLVGIGYSGAIIPINPNLVSAAGIPCYPTLDAVPGSFPVDYAIIAVSKKYVIDCLKQCIKHKVKVATIFTSGYSEDDPVRGRKDEQEILDLLQEGYKQTGHRLRVLGPNCMGVYFPRNQLAFRSDMEIESGNVGIISQSGGLAINIVLKGKLTGIKFSKVVSIGNSIDLKPDEIVRLMAMDDETRIIGAYFESFGRTMEESRRLFDAVKETAKKKPVIIWRGGRSERGSIAASSHTGALKTSSQMWEAFIKQSGVIAVTCFEEFMDTLEAFQFLNNKYPGKRIGLISISGGSAVTATDEIIDAGLEIPPLEKESQKAILNLAVADVGVSTKNPVDLGNSYFGFSIIEKTVEIMLGDPNVDILLFEISTHYIYNATVMSMKEFPEIYFENAIKTVKHARRSTKKPVFIIMPEVAYEAETINNRQVFLKNNTPVFPNVRRAVTALRNVGRFAEWGGKRP
ncbi:MAG: CoA-binding protein [Candidatus Lokiarchaeota archaeon]|nr:CoA-binding protein [Candidatus Lokiarchaeota archaeon]